MISGLVSGIPTSTPDHPNTRPTHRLTPAYSAAPQWDTPLPLPELILSTEPTPPQVLYDVRRIDPAGRVMVGALLDALGWQPGHQPDVHLAEGILTVTGEGDGRARVDNQGNLRLRAQIRRDAEITTSDRLLLIADLPTQKLLILPPAAAMRLLTPLIADTPEGHLS